MAPANQETNHVLALMDKRTVEGRILKADAGAAEQLDGVTRARVTAPHQLRT